MSSFFFPDPHDDIFGTPRKPIRRLLLRIVNVALAGLLAWVVAGSAACAIRLVLNH